jgi:hypothetical protein
VKVFLSYAVGNLDSSFAARLRAVAAAYDVVILLPDRTRIPHNGMEAETQSQIKQSDAVIALVTGTSSLTGWNQVNLELQAATQAGKPIIALVEQGVPFQGAPGTQLIQFDRYDPTAHEASLMAVLAQIKQQQQWKKDLTALGWIAGIALGLVALTELFDREK